MSKIICFLYFEVFRKKWNSYLITTLQSEPSETIANVRVLWSSYTVQGHTKLKMQYLCGPGWKFCSKSWVNWLKELISQYPSDGYKISQMGHQDRPII